MSFFRKEALDNFETDANQFKSVKSIHLHVWLLILLLTVCCAFFVYWLVFGTINETLSVQCVVWPYEKVNNVYSSVNGEISKVLVQEGTFVETGDILAVLPQEEFLASISQQKSIVPEDQEQISALRRRYIAVSLVRAKTTGIVTYVADEHSYAEKGTKIAEIAPFDKNGNDRTLVAYLPADKMGLLSLGMEVQVTPEYLSRAGSGFAVGYLSEISDVSVKGEEIKSDDTIMFTSNMTESESYVKVEITLLPDSTNPGNLKWSRAESRNIDFEIGTVCSGNIVIHQSNPLNWLF